MCRVAVCQVYTKTDGDFLRSMVRVSFVLAHRQPSSPDCTEKRSVPPMRAALTTSSADAFPESSWQQSCFRSSHKGLAHCC